LFRLLTLLANIRLGWKGLPRINTQAYLPRAPVTERKQGLKVFVSYKLFLPGLIFVSNARGNTSGAPLRYSFSVRLLLGTTRLSYLFSGLHYKCFTIITYNCNDNGLYYITNTLANLALARSINYNHKLCCKLKCTL
jgi:hypothetical protein